MHTVWAIHPDLAAMVTGFEQWERGLSKDNPMRPVGYMAMDEFQRPVMWQAATQTPTGKPSRVAVVPIQGTMVKRSGWWSLGTAQLARYIEIANQDASISAIVLDIDSGGGMVDGTEELGQAVAQSKKPIVAYVDGMAASAAYWVASQAKSIVYKSDGVSYIGSIGVLSIYSNVTKALERWGIEAKILRATDNPDKARPNSLEPLTEELEGEVIGQLDSIKSQFDELVKTGRAGRLTPDSEQAFTGKVYTGAQALKMGLVDQKGSLQDAIRLAAQMAESPTAATRADQSQATDTEMNTNATEAAEKATSATDTQATNSEATASVETPAPATAEAPAASEATASQEQPAASGIEARVAAIEAGQARIESTLATISGWVKGQATPAAGEDAANSGASSAKKVDAWDAEAIALHQKFNPKKK